MSAIEMETQGDQEGRLTLTVERSKFLHNQSAVLVVRDSCVSIDPLILLQSQRTTARISSCRA